MKSAIKHHSLILILIKTVFILKYIYIYFPLSLSLSIHLSFFSPNKSPEIFFLIMNAMAISRQIIPTTINATPRKTFLPPNGPF